MFLDRSRDYSCGSVLVLLSGDSGFDSSVRKAQTQRCHVEVLYEHGAHSLTLGCGALGARLRLFVVAGPTLLQKRHVSEWESRNT
jgi:hypothetical protein